MHGSAKSFNNSSAIRCEIKWFTFCEVTLIFLKNFNISTRSEQMNATMRHSFSI